MNKTELTTWEIRTYDVWGTRENGYDVNDSFVIARDYPIKCKIQIFNAGLESEFDSASPSDYQIKKALNVNCNLEISGDDIHIYVNRESDYYPLGELVCSSHSSLSPIIRL